MEYLWSFIPSGHWWHGHNAAFLEIDYNDFFPSLDVTLQFDIHGWRFLFSIHPHVQIITVMIYWNMFFLLLYLSFNQDWLKFLEETWTWHEVTSWMCQIWKGEFKYWCYSFLDWICFMNPMYFIALNSQIGSPIYVKWYISEDMMPFGGEYVMYWSFSGYKIFFYNCEIQKLPQVFT